MTKKLIAVLMAVLMLLSITACGAQDDNDDDFISRDIDVNLDAYDECGAAMTVKDMNSGEEFELGMLGLLAASGETVGDALAASGYADITPCSGDDTFEGWMEYETVTAVDENGIEYDSRKLVSDTVYTTEQLLAIKVDRTMNFVAKWASVDVEDYFVVNPWDGVSSSGAFSFSANGGSISFREADGREYNNPVYTYWLDDGNTLADIMGTESGAELVGVTKDGATFTGWTLYVAESIFWNNEVPDEEDIAAFIYDEEYEDTHYILLRNGAVYKENVSTEELCAIEMHGKNYYAVANWA